VQVYCRNTGKPKDKRKACPSACIGCSLCVKNCPYEAVKVENFLAVVDHSKCPADCPRPCLDRCPTAAILARGLGCHEKNEALLAKHKNLLT
jgi:ferredoxin